MILNPTVRQALIASSSFKDGSSWVTIVWIGLDGDEIVCAHQNFYKKIEEYSILCPGALSMVKAGKTNGLQNYLVINGLARITEGGAR
jgi:hypothetical protein